MTNLAPTPAPPYDLTPTAPATGAPRGIMHQDTPYSTLTLSRRKGQRIVITTDDEQIILEVADIQRPEGREPSANISIFGPRRYAIVREELTRDE